MGASRLLGFTQAGYDESCNVKLMEHERLNEEALQTSEGNGYVITCSCGEVIEVPVGAITDGRARQLAIMKWHGHADDS